MQELSPAIYMLFYKDSKIIHTVYYNGQVVTSIKQTAKYFVITLSTGVAKTIRDTDMLQVRNSNKFAI